MIPADGSAGGANAYAAEQAAKRTTGWHNQCLRFVRTSFGAPAKGGSAKTAWAAAKHKHPGDRNPPKGVAVFFQGGTYGHVVSSRQEGRVYSSDIHVDDQVRACSIHHIESKWGMKYLGWTEDVNGKRLEDIPLPRVTLETLQERIAGGSRYVGIPTVAKALKAKGYSGFTTSNKWTKGKKRAYKKWQKACGFSGSAADGIPGRVSLTKLGKNHSHGFTVR